MLQSMGSQRVGHDWATEQQQLPTSNLLTLSLSSCLENLPTLDTAVCCQLAGSTSGYPLSVAAVKRKKRYYIIVDCIPYIVCFITVIH